MSRLDFISNRKEIFIDNIKTTCKSCGNIIFYSYYKKAFIDSDSNPKDYIKVKKCKCDSNNFNYEFVIKNLGIKIVKGYVNKKGKVVKSNPDRNSYTRNPPELTILKTPKYDDDDNW